MTFWNVPTTAKSLAAACIWRLCTQVHGSASVGSMKHGVISNVMVIGDSACPFRRMAWFRCVPSLCRFWWREVMGIAPPMNGCPTEVPLGAVWNTDVSR